MGLLADLEGGGRRRRRDDDVAPFEGRLEVLLDERPYLLGLEIISVVVAGGEGVGSEFVTTTELQSDKHPPTIQSSDWGTTGGLGTLVTLKIHG